MGSYFNQQSDSKERKATRTWKKSRPQKMMKEKKVRRGMEKQFSFSRFALFSYLHWFNFPFSLLRASKRFDEATIARCCALLHSTWQTKKKGTRLTRVQTSNEL